jgi:hypothetical protein
MASYPTSQKAFTTKNAGDTIQPGHVNDIQDEIMALEAGLLNGTAPLTSSRATVAALTVVGGSTLATLQVAGNSTIAGTLTVNKIISTSLTNAGGVTSYVRAFRDATQAPASTAYTVVAYNSEVADLLSEWDSTGGTFTPQSSGYYLVQAGVKAGVISGDPCFRLGIFVNGTVASVCEESAGIGNMDPRTYAVSGVLNLSAGAPGLVTIKASAPVTSTVVLSSGVEYSFVNILKLY